MGMGWMESGIVIASVCSGLSALLCGCRLLCLLVASCGSRLLCLCLLAPSLIPRRLSGALPRQFHSVARVLLIALELWVHALHAAVFEFLNFELPALGFVESIAMRLERRIE